MFTLAILAICIATLFFVIGKILEHPALTLIAVCFGVAFILVKYSGNLHL